MQKFLDKFYLKMWGIKESLKNDIVKLGDYLQLVTPIVFLIYSSCFLGTYISRVFIVSYIIANIIQVLLKSLFNNPRPSETEGTDNPDLNFDWSVNEGESFPSGHTMSAMIGGVFWLLMPKCGNIPFLGIFGILLGVITGISRVIAKAHWLRDILTSSLISGIIYWIAYTYYIKGIG
jgi:membrane-associated phospholipid phosphatase